MAAAAAAAAAATQRHPDEKSRTEEDKLMVDVVGTSDPAQPLQVTCQTTNHHPGKFDTVYPIYYYTESRMT